MEQLSKKPLTREVWTVSQLRARLAGDPDNAMAKYHVVFAEGRGISWDVSNTFNQRHHIPVTDLRKWLTMKPRSAARPL